MPRDRPKANIRPDHNGPQRAQFESNKKKIYATQKICGICGKPAETLQRRARAAPETAVKSMHDDRMKAEARFRSRAGLQCFITRRAVSGCCEWCSKVAGRYAYGEEPDGIYRRHDNCDCTVTFENGRKRQDVWSKREWEVPEENAGAGEPVRLTAEQAAEREAQHPTIAFTPGQAKSLQDSILTNGAENGITQVCHQIKCQRSVRNKKSG